MEAFLSSQQVSGSPYQQNVPADLALGLFLGWFLLLAGFSLVAWIIQRERANLYFFISQLFSLLGIFSGNLLVFSPDLLASGLPLGLGRLSSLPGIFWAAMIGLFTILFVHALVSGSRLPDRLNRLMGPVVGLWALMGIASIWEPLRISPGVLAMLAVFSVLFMIVMALTGLAKGYRPAAYVIIGLVLALTGWLAGLALDSRLAMLLPGISLIVMSLLLAAALYDHQLFSRANLGRSLISLRENENRLRQYLEALPFSAAVVGPDSGLQWSNRRFASLFSSRDRPETFPTSLKELFYHYPLYRAGTTELYPLEQFPSNAALRGKAARIEDVELEKEEGRYPLEIWAEPLLDQRQNPAAALIVCQDIGGRRQIEQEMARHVQDLQLMVDLRLEELRYEHEDRKKVETVLHRLATTDPLTGLLNRRQWSSLAERYLQQSTRYQHPLSLIMMDIDHFNYINEIYGHRVGDETLIQIAATIRDSMRNVDLLARYGGDEFIILLPDTGQAGAEVVAERLRERIANLMVEHNEGPVVVTVSIGLAAVLLGDMVSLENLIEQADLALYGAKHSGRNRVMTYAPMEVT